MRHALRLLLLATAFALGTWTFGWLALVLLAVGWGGIATDRRAPALEAGVAAMIAWAAILAFGALRESGLVAGSGVASAMGVPMVVLIVATLAFAALLAWSASRVAGVIASRLFRITHDPWEPPDTPAPT